MIHSTINHQLIDYQIAHILPGRIRFKVPRLVKDADYQRKLIAVAQADRAVKSVQINSVSGSIAIEYDDHIISEDELRSRFVYWLKTAPKTDLSPEKPAPEAPQL